ncbi:MAG: lytic transglycosylase domain-containing protein [Rickettsiaceae bacterium]|nr:MAG: lytic transglycosylase domain-containing protein [Rickettsiaceae bacterium]
MRSISLFCLYIIINISSTNFVLAIDYEITQSLKCMKVFAQNEQTYAIPSDVLHSIAIKESGKLHGIYKVKIPWPWAVNVEGQSYYFNSKNEAIAFVKKQISNGKASIDIGCMQINLKHHIDAFASLEHAFDPSINVAYGAKFLRAKFDQLQCWHKAIAYYHSATSDIGHNYKKDVIKIIKNMHHHKKILKKHIFDNHTQPQQCNDSTSINQRDSSTKQDSVKIKLVNNSSFQNKMRSNIMIPIY